MKIQEGLDRLEREEKELKGRNKTDFDDEVEKLLKKEGITRNIDRKGDYFRVFRENYIKLESLKIKWKRELLLGETKSQYDLVSQILDGGFDDEKLDKKNAFARDSHLQPTEQELQERLQQSESILGSRIQSNEPHPAPTKRISDVVEQFLDLRKGTIGQKLLEEYKSICDDFIEIVGDIPVGDVSKDTIRTYINTQIKLPTNRNKNPKYKDLSISKMLKLKKVKPQSRQNVNKYLTRLSTMMNFGSGQGYFRENFILGMKLPVSKKESKKREPFTDEELMKILSPRSYFRWTVDFSKTTKTDRPDAVKYQNAYYWSFIIGIFSGMRTNEIAQLKITDILQENNVWMFSVDEEDDKSVKTPNSIRRVPIHPTLISLGFIDYFEIMKSKGVDRFFPELTREKDGYASKISRHYNEKFLPFIGVWKSRVKVLYSTRHTFINRCYKKGVDTDVIKCIVGHEPDFTFGVYGGSPFSPKQLHKSISKVKYKNIRWDRMKVDWKEKIVR